MKEIFLDCKKKWITPQLTIEEIFLDCKNKMKQLKTE